jgi:hypothetical protein
MVPTASSAESFVGNLSVVQPEHPKRDNVAVGIVNIVLDD